MQKPVDLSFYYITDDLDPRLDAIVSTALKAVEGGASLVQLRNPNAKAGVLFTQAKALVEALRPSGVPLIINDRPDVAHAVGAAGVHLGQGDLPIEAARSILGPKAIIGLSITHLDDMQHVPWDLVNHLGVGPVFSKGVKSDATEPMGLAGLKACIAVSKRPVVAIGGMGLETVASCIEAGTAGLAVVSAISRHPDPEKAAREIRHAIDQALIAERKAK